MADTKIDRSAFYSLSSGLYIVSSVDSSGRRCGCIVNTLLQVTSKPPQLLIAINKDNYTTRAIEENGQFCASVLAQSATMDLIGAFGFKTSVEIDKFENVEIGISAAGIPYISQDCVAYFLLKVEQRIDVGTHVLLITSVEEAQKLSDAQPLTYEYYHDVIKGGTPPQASSFNPDSALPSAHSSLNEETVEPKLSTNVGWKCLLCGKVIEGYPEGLPEDFKCPVCGVGPEYFQKIEL